jgi:hypothetical protein
VTVSPVAVLTAAMVLMMTSWLVSGRPRQFRVIWENSRCSIWGEMRAFLGARQLAGAEPLAEGCGGGYPASMSWTVKPSFSSWLTRRRAWCSLSWREVK